MIRPLVIYHGNCADGFTAAWCFWKKYGLAAEFVAGVYQQPPPDCAGRDVYLVDFSYKRDVVEEMVASALNVWLIDHHKSALDDLAALDGLLRYVDLHRSGARLAWDFLFEGQAPPPLLDHIEDRDLWRFRLSGTREISAAVFSHEYTFENWDVLMAAGTRELAEMVTAGAAIERKHHKDIAELVKVCRRRMTIAGYHVWAASLPYTYSSDAGHLMAVDEPFAACYWDTLTERVFSLRSTETGMDVSLVAQLYGGGGHVHAAGFKVPRTHALAMW